MTGRVIAARIALLALAGVTPARAQAPDSAIVACVADRVTASPADTVGLRAFAEPLDTAAARGWRVSAYGWSASRGVITGRGARVQWVPRGAPLGPASATATVGLPGGKVGRCVARVTIVPPRGDMGGMLRARTFLAPGVAEEPGFGLYSYLLMPAPPDSAARQRVTLALAEYLRLTQDLARVRPAAAERPRVNVSYLPTTRALSDPPPDSVLRYYDYVAAQRLLRKLPGVRTDGLYLVSVPGTPLSARDSVTRPYLEQNLSTAPEPVVAPMVGYFLRLADQERFDGGPALQRLVLNARTAVGVAALGLPAVVRSMGEWRKLWAEWVQLTP